MSLMEAIALAQAYEAKSEESKISGRPWTKWNVITPPPQQTTHALIHHVHNKFPSIYPHASFATPKPSSQPPLLPTLKPIPPPPLLPTPAISICRLSSVELKEKRDKGLCYNYDQKYSANHHCCSKFLLLLGTDDDDSDPSEESL